MNCRRSYVFVTLPSLGEDGRAIDLLRPSGVVTNAGRIHLDRQTDTMRKLATLVATLVAVQLVPGRAVVAQAATIPPIDFSGVLFLNYQTRTDSAAKTTTGGKPTSKFDIERVYLIFRMPAGDRGAIRVTTDIFQNTGGGGYYPGWTVRLKHAYFQYELSKNLAGVQGLTALGRFGMLHTVVVDHIEQFWPRYLGSTAVERNGFFASADVGAATLMTLPNRRGEIYATITNGSNYSSAETDRFKDIAARVSITPFGNDSGFFRTLTITPWYYLGASQSAFVAPPTSESDGVKKDRRGIFLGLRERRLTAGIDFDQRVEEVENAPPAARTVTDRTSQLVSAFALVRPAEWADAKKRSKFSLLARWDKFRLNKDIAASTANPGSTFLVLGASYDLTTRTIMTLDYQELSRESGSTTVIPTKTLFLHWQVQF